MNRLEKLKEMEAAKPDDAFLKFAIALEYAGQQNDTAARSIFECLIDKQPGYLATYYQLGNLYERAGEPEKAKLIYQQGTVVAQKAHDAKTLRELNEALMMLED